MTKFAPPQALKLIERGRLTFDERVVLHRVDRGTARKTHPHLGTPQGPRHRPTVGSYGERVFFWNHGWIGAMFELDARTVKMVSGLSLKVKAGSRS